MPKTPNAERIAKSREKRGIVRVELQVLPEIKAKFEELASINGVSKRELFERLVEQGITEDIKKEKGTVYLTQIDGALLS